MTSGHVRARDKQQRGHHRHERPQRLSVLAPQGERPARRRHECGGAKGLAVPRARPAVTGLLHELLKQRVGRGERPGLTHLRGEAADDGEIRPSVLRVEKPRLVERHHRDRQRDVVAAAGIQAVKSRPGHAHDRHVSIVDGQNPAEDVRGSVKPRCPILVANDGEHAGTGLPIGLGGKAPADYDGASMTA